jgi:hypothetical protein
VNNTIAGNGIHGVYVIGDNCTLRSNFIGVDGTGRRAAPNHMQGVYSLGKRTLLDSCVVSGNGVRGILLSGPNAEVRNCLVGVGVAGGASGGVLALANGAEGLVIDAADALVQGSVVAGNADAGIFVTSRGFTATIVNCSIGVSADGVLAVPNRHAGVLAHAVGTTLLRNTIAYNLGGGVSVNALSFPVFLRGNVLQANVGAGVLTEQNAPWPVATPEVYQPATGMLRVVVTLPPTTPPVFVAAAIDLELEVFGDPLLQAGPAGAQGAILLFRQTLSNVSVARDTTQADFDLTALPVSVRYVTATVTFPILGTSRLSAPTVLFPTLDACTICTCVTATGLVNCQGKVGAGAWGWFVLYTIGKLIRGI